MISKTHNTLGLALYNTDFILKTQFKKDTISKKKE
jgi:hypothetical protein